MVCALKSIGIFSSILPSNRGNSRKALLQFRRGGKVKMKKVGTQLRNLTMQTTVILMMKNTWMMKKMTAKKSQN